MNQTAQNQFVRTNQIVHMGDYLFTAANNKHSVSSKTGCVLLLVVPQEVEIIEPRTLKESSTDENEIYE